MEDLNKYLPQDDDADDGIEVFFVDHEKRADYQVHPGNVVQMLEAEISDLDRKMREADPNQTWDAEEMVELMREGFRWFSREIGRIQYDNVSETATALVAAQWVMVLGTLLEQPEIIDLVRACHRPLCAAAREFERQQHEQLRKVLVSLKEDIQARSR